MFNRYDTNKSTKGASKLRRDLINAEIANLRELLPLPPSSRQRLSQLQLMALVCVYVRKENYFQQVFKKTSAPEYPIPNIGFSKALCGFLMMMTRNGKLLYISDNAAEYLGHSMEDLLIHGDSVYDIIDKQDHQAIQDELGKTLSNAVSEIRPNVNSTQQNCTVNTLDEQTRIFLCRMNVSRNARRQMRFGDQKIILVKGHFLSFLPLCSRNEPVFLATCTPIAMPETRECVVQGATNVFTSIHSLDMKFLHLDKNGEYYLEYTKKEIQGCSWYCFLHWENICEAQAKHRAIIQNEQDRTCILLLRLQKRSGNWLWVHSVLQVKENLYNSQNTVIVCTNQVLSENEALVMYTNAWLYHCYMSQNKFHYGLTNYETQNFSNVISYCHHNNKQCFIQNNITYLTTESHMHGNHYVSRNVAFQTKNLQNQQKLSDNNEKKCNYYVNDSKLLLETEPVDYSIHTNNHDNFKSVILEAPTYIPLAVAKSLTQPSQNKRKTHLLAKVTPVNSDLLKFNNQNVDFSSNILLPDSKNICSSNNDNEIILVSSAANIPLTSITLQYALSRSNIVPLEAHNFNDKSISANEDLSLSCSDNMMRKMPNTIKDEIVPNVNNKSAMTFMFDWPPEKYTSTIINPETKTLLESNLKVSPLENNSDYYIINSSTHQ